MFMYPDNLKGAYAFLTIRFNDTSIFDFLQYACAFFIYHQQIYYWEYTGFVSAGNNENYYRKRKIWR